MEKRWLLLPVCMAALVAPLGCATKQFVRDEVRERDVSIGRLETDLGQERARVGEIGAQVTDVRSRADSAARRAEQAAGVGQQALQRADEAGARATNASTKAEETDRRLTRLWATRNQRSAGEKFVIQFRFDRADLDDRAETALLEAVKALEENPNAVVTLEGYADPRGPAAHNLLLSERRAQAVRRFMAQKGIELHRIQAIGFGETAPASPPGAPAERGAARKVVVTLLVPAE
ncbi:MAG: OmpA family protein [Candidatus Methylomirabilales bacterium]